MDFLKGQPNLDLTGQWSFAYTDTPPTRDPASIDDLAKSGLTLHPCTVPGNFELDLQAVGVIGEPFYAMNIVALTRFERCHVWYGRSFRAEPRPGLSAELVFQGLDCIADVYLNGKLLGSCDNMLVEHVFNVDGRLRADNELLVHIKPAVDEARKFPYPRGAVAGAINYESLYVRKAPHMYGWDIMPRALSAGIWRPVELRFRPHERIEQLYIETIAIRDDLSRADLCLSYHLKTSGGPGCTLEVDSRCGQAAFALKVPVRFDAGSHVFSVQHPMLWWPRGYGKACIYQCTARLVKDGATLDEAAFSLGIRSAQLARTSLTNAVGDGEFCFKINGQRIFAKGSNWVPLDAFHSRDAGRTAAVLALAEDANCNILRCWGGNVYESDLFFQLCDEAGIMIWQDFAMACAIYPQDADFRRRVADEARCVVRRLRQHPCIVLWAGDNECDAAYPWYNLGDPNNNALTRKVLPSVLRDEDPNRPFLPSSPYIDSEAYKAGADFITENHLWGPRNYYKSDFYLKSVCHFASEIGYHGCPAPDSIRRFISPAKVWPYKDNDEWLLHGTSPVPGFSAYDYRIELMATQVRCLFGAVPDSLEEYALASQITQAEAKKFFIELFRGSKWRRTGIIWWNLMDGWPQFSDAVVDYYFNKKLAYDFIKRSQQDVIVMIREPEGACQQVVACNDTRQAAELDYEVKDADTAEVLAAGRAVASANSTTLLAEIPFNAALQRFYLIEWAGPAASGRNHYLAGRPPFDLVRYKTWLHAAGLMRSCEQ